MNNNDARPGLMLYFEDLEPFMSALSSAQLGELLLALLRYGRDGTEPAELDALTALGFRVLRPRMDRDARRYAEKQRKSQYAAYCREQDRLGLPRLDFALWLQTEKDADPPQTASDDIRRASTAFDSERHHSTSDDIERCPTATPTVTPTAASTAASTAAANAKENGELPPPPAADAPPARGPRPRFSPPKKEELEAYAREAGLDLDADAFLDYYAANGWRVGKSPMKDWRAAARSWSRRERASPRQSAVGFRRIPTDEEYERGWGD